LYCFEVWRCFSLWILFRILFCCLMKKEKKFDAVQIAVLAAGKGKRMGSEGSKVLVPVLGKPMIERILDEIESSGVGASPIVVVGYDAEHVCQLVGRRGVCVVQKEQLGTGHAVKTVLEAIGPETTCLVILYGDHPFISIETMRTLAEHGLSENSAVTLLTVCVPDFDGWRALFMDFGRVVRNPDGTIREIVEKKDASPEQLAIHEVNPGYYAFQTDWLRSHIEKLTNENNQKEFYLTDLISMAMRGGGGVEAIPIEDPIEGLGVNTPEQLALAEAAYREKRKKVDLD